jgi:hypothetical protein
MLGAIFGAISGALVLPIAAVVLAFDRGESVARSLSHVDLLVFAAIPGCIGAIVGGLIGLVIGIVVALFIPIVSARAVPRFVRGVILAVTIAATIGVGVIAFNGTSPDSTFERLFPWCLLPGAFAIGLGQVGARWMIRAAQR